MSAVFWISNITMFEIIMIIIIIIMMMISIMNNDKNDNCDNNQVYLLPSGFAALPHNVWSNRLHSFHPLPKVNQISKRYQNIMEWNKDF